MNNPIYKIDTHSLEDALTVVYSFMTDEGLNNPECTVFGNETGNQFFPNILAMYDGRDSMPDYTEFIKRTKKLDFSAISCVSSTDKDDRRRVTLSYIPEVGFVAMSFPMAYDGINASEKLLLERMSL
ncbi:MAG: hypothetical protein IJS17_03540 [Clostridia bacterium]|nr:hypothetical protein [Clostridia bacterium]